MPDVRNKIWKENGNEARKEGGIIINGKDNAIKDEYE